MQPKLHPLQLALLIALASQSPLAIADAAADTAPTAPTAAAATPSSKAASSDVADSASAPTLGSVVVSASALSLGVLEMSTPVSVLAGDQLVQDRAASLGETLSREPGIHSTHFGAGASRPIIRGMDGPRVKVLSDGAEVMDASTVSPDHAVAVDPMLSEQIEVLRGPSALAYGGGAIGGVVNVLDRKIPTAIPARGVDGSVEFRANTAAREAAGAFEVTAGTGSFAIHAEGLKRDARDYRVGSGWSEGSHVDGSYNQTESSSLGLSWIGDRGWLGLAYTHQRNEYGLPGHDHDLEDCHTHGDHLHCGSHDDDDDDHDHDETHADVPYVDLISARWDLRGEYREPFAGFARVRVRASHTDYRHDEIEDGEVATRFRSKGHDGRVELEHHPLAAWRGVVGLQSSRRDFSAIGEEAYLEPTLTRKNALYLVETLEAGAWRVEAALRREWQRIDTDSGAADRSHHGNSVSLGAVWNFTPGYALGASLSRAQRLPTAEELYANGLHLATKTLERGNAELKPETSHNLDLSLRKHSGDTTFAVSAFHNRVSDYIYANTLDEHDGLQLIEYAQRDATFTGIEGQIRQRLNAMFGLTLFGDHVRAKLSGGDNLPRTPANRLGLRLDGQWQKWKGEAEAYRVARQDRISDFETSTPGYNMFNLGLSYSARINALPYLFYIKGSNLTDERAYSHTSFIKDAAPLTGRNLTMGVRVTF